MHRRFAVIILLGSLCLFARGPAAGAATLAVPNPQTYAFDQVLRRDAGVRSALGPSFDVVRIEPVAYRPGQFVVEAATADRVRGLRALVDSRTSTVIRIEPVDTADILFTGADVARAFSIVRNFPAIRTRLGATLDLYRVGNSYDSSSPPYRIDGIPVRGASVHDPCSTHRCLDLLFHAPAGYLEMPEVLVDLTTSARVMGRSTEVAHPISRPAAGVPVRATPATTCHNVTFTAAPSSWNVCWYHVTGYGTLLGTTSYKKAVGSTAFGVIGDARVDQIFVPYASGSPRYYDVSFGFPLWVIPQALCNGTLYDSRTVCVEIRDRGIDWAAESGVGGRLPGRRGQEAVVWSVLAAANYLYIEEWGFRDDGVLWGRVEPTGQNLPGVEHESHTHDFIWRIVPALAGTGNSVNHVTMSEPVTGLTAQDVVTPVAQPVGFTWKPHTFDELEVYPPGATNGLGDQISYRLVPMPTAGLAHHNEPWTQDDLWATTGDPLELDVTKLPQYDSEHTSLVNTTVTLWYRGSFHHQPRDEDGFYGNNGWFGASHALGTGFMLLPRNLFDHSPFYP